MHFAGAGWRPGALTGVRDRSEERGLSAKDEVVLEATEEDAPFADIEELQTLVTEGRERGDLSFEEIAACLEEVEVTKEQVQELHAHLLEHGVEVVSQDGKPVPAHDAASAAKDAQPPAGPRRRARRQGPDVPQEGRDPPLWGAEPRLSSPLSALHRTRGPA